MKYSIIILIMLSLTFQGIGKELSVQGWIILSNNMDNAIETIEKAKNTELIKFNFLIKLYII